MHINARARDESQCNKGHFWHESVEDGRCMQAGRLCARAAFASSRANIERGAERRSGRKTMDLFTVVIIAAILATMVTVFLGVLTMSVGGSTDKTLSTPLMWVRVGFQALTLLLLFAAIRLR
jgi:hypothetical protein